MCPGFDSLTQRHMWIEFVVGFRPCSKGFSPGSLVFLPPQKPTFLNSNLIGNSRATGLSVEDCCVSPSLNKVYLFIYLFIYLSGINVSKQTLHSCRGVKAVSVWRSAMVKWYYGFWECFYTPISETLAQTFSNCFLFNLLLFSGSLATSCCQNADKNKMAELWTLVFKVKLSFHTK